LDFTAPWHDEKRSILGESDLDRRVSDVIYRNPPTENPAIGLNGEIRDVIMQLGIFDHMQKNDKPERSYADMYANHLETLEFADQAGMDFYFVAEHHFDQASPSARAPERFSAPHRKGQRESA
jgi:hypothetical protein